MKLRVAPAAAVALQHEGPVIVERINAFLGYPAVARLAFVQVPLAPARPRAPAARPLRAEERDALAEQVKGVADEELRAALERLGAAVRRAEDA